MARLTKRKDGRYQTKVYLGIFNGKPKYKYVYGKTQKEVNQKVNEIKYKKENNLYINPKNMFLEEFLKEWLEIHKANIAETTYELYEMYIEKHISPHLGKIRLNKILPIHIQKFYNDKLKEQKGQTVRKYHNLLHKAFDYAVRNEILLYNPCDRVDKPKNEKFAPEVCDDQTFFRLLEIVKGTFDEVPIMLAAGLGLRRGEVFGLRWQDIDFKKKTVKIRETKVRFNEYTRKKPKSDSSIREITIPDVVIDTLIRYKSKKKVLSQYICDEYQPDSYSKRFRRILDKNGLPPLRFHDLRHYNAVLMMKLGIPDRVGADRMGHSTTKTLKEIYQHATKDMDQLAAEKINQALKR